MDANFWHRKWENNHIGFHEASANQRLTTHIEELGIAAGGRVFLPLCGKTRDVAWLMARGYRAAGAELSELAVQQLFAEMNMTPTVTEIGVIKHYAAPDVDIFVGDIFDVTREILGPVDAIFDRAALVALGAEVRVRYARHLVGLTVAAPQLLVTYEYHGQQPTLPPFSVTADEVQRLYGADYGISLLADDELVGGMKGTTAVREKAWLLK